MKLLDPPANVLEFPAVRPCLNVDSKFIRVESRPGGIILSLQESQGVDRVRTAITHQCALALIALLAEAVAHTGGVAPNPPNPEAG